MIDGLRSHDRTKDFSTRDFRLQSGIVMPSVTIAYATLGTLAPDRGNAVLVTHGNTSGPQMIDPGGSTGEGSWNELVGPGKAVDTNRFFAICPNMLGSSYGSTNAASIDPATGKPYGPRFPDITVSDIVATHGCCSIISASKNWLRSSDRPMAASRPFNGRSIIPAR